MGCLYTDLLDILKGVKSWCTLGLCLGIPMEVLEEIKSKRMRAKKRSRKIMTTWMEKEINAWEKLVRALDEVGATSLAYAVAQQYGELCSLFTAQPGCETTVTGDVLQLDHICMIIELFFYL